MPFTRGIYYEKQKGGLCRMHALNAYFKNPEFTPAQFSTLMTEYDKKNKNKFKTTISCTLYDSVNSDQNTIISYALKRKKMFSRYFPINSCYKKPMQITTDFIFVFNHHHIWGMRKIAENGKDTWFKVDSLSGVTSSNINGIFQIKNIGIIMPVKMSDEFYRNIRIIKNELRMVNKLEKGDEITEKHIQNYLRTQYQNKNIIGEIEVPLSIVFSIFEMGNPIIKKNPLKHIITGKNTSRIIKSRYVNIQIGFGKQQGDISGVDNSLAGQSLSTHSNLEQSNIGNDSYVSTVITSAGRSNNLREESLLSCGQQFKKIAQQRKDSNTSSKKSSAVMHNSFQTSDILSEKQGIENGKCISIVDKFKIIKKLTFLYGEFLQNFIGDYNNINLIITYLQPILTHLVNLSG
jgi:hypothetical protein